MAVTKDDFGGSKDPDAGSCAVVLGSWAVSRPGSGVPRVCGEGPWLGWPWRAVTLN